MTTVNVMTKPDNEFRELSEDEILSVSGAIGFLAGAAMIGAGLALFQSAESAGQRVGRALFNMVA